MADQQNPQASEAEVQVEQPVEDATEQAQAETVEQSADSEVTSEQSVEALQQELEQAQQALSEAQEQVLRAQADVQNMRRRAEQDVAKARKFALEKFAEELLPVVDNLERGIESAQGDQADVAAIREGSEMTLNMFISALKKFNVEPVDPQDEPFDPQLHQAMSMVDNPNVEPNTVLHVMQKGYLLNGRLVRPAMVMVSKGGEKKPDAPKIDEQV